MKKIYEWALNHIEASASIIHAVSMLQTDHAERFVEVSVGCHINDNDVPQEFIYNDKLHKLIHCNYILDKIVYETVDTDYRYFDNQEDVDKFSKNGDYRWNRSSFSKSEEYTIKGAWTRPVEHETDYDRWFAWANIKM